MGHPGPGLVAEASVLGSHLWRWPDRLRGTPGCVWGVLKLACGFVRQSPWASAAHIMGGHRLAVVVGGLFVALVSLGWAGAWKRALHLVGRPSGPWMWCPCAENGGSAEPGVMCAAALLEA